VGKWLVEDAGRSVALTFETSAESAAPADEAIAGLGEVGARRALRRMPPSLVSSEEDEGDERDAVDDTRAGGCELRITTNSSPVVKAGALAKFTARIGGKKGGAKRVACGLRIIQHRYGRVALMAEEVERCKVQG
jgi:hypothetical protein